MNNPTDKQIGDLAKMIYAQNVNTLYFHRTDAQKIAVSSVEASKLFHEVLSEKYNAE